MLTIIVKYILFNKRRKTTTTVTPAAGTAEVQTTKEMYAQTLKCCFAPSADYLGGPPDRADAMTWLHETFLCKETGATEAGTSQKTRS